MEQSDYQLIIETMAKDFRDQLHEIKLREADKDREIEKWKNEAKYYKRQFWAAQQKLNSIAR